MEGGHGCVSREGGRCEGFGDEVDVDHLACAEWGRGGVACVLVGV
jgi:hypothetical protein